MAIIFDLVATNKALDDLADLYIKTPRSQRSQITKAADFFDRYLQTDAHLKGMAYPNNPNRRFSVKYPLIIHFDVSEDDRRVTILAFHEAKQPP